MSDVATSEVAVTSNIACDRPVHTGPGAHPAKQQLADYLVCFNLPFAVYSKNE